MSTAQRKAAFVLAATDHGPLILNRFDYKPLGPDDGIGVGYNLLLNSSYDMQEVRVGAAMLDLAHTFRGNGVVAVDCGQPGFHGRGMGARHDRLGTLSGC